jgi:hypothetical protein
VGAHTPGETKPRRARPRSGSVYETRRDLGPPILDDEEIEEGWDRIGELDPLTGLWKRPPGLPSLPPPGEIWWR